ncbi:MAG: hypothetical protein ACI8PT_003045 [Gammaproteobacteria bacterium]|jgi:hypothetical protein
MPWGRWTEIDQDIGFNIVKNDIARELVTNLPPSCVPGRRTAPACLVQTPRTTPVAYELRIVVVDLVCAVFIEVPPPVHTVTAVTLSFPAVVLVETSPGIIMIAVVLVAPTVVAIPVVAALAVG